MVEQRANGAGIRYCSADLFQLENENLDAGDYCQDFVARVVRKHANRNFNKPLEVFSLSGILDEYCRGGYIFHGDDLHQRLVFQSNTT